MPTSSEPTLPLPLGDPLPITTDRLVLRPYTEADLDGLAEMYGSAATVRYLYDEVLRRDQLGNKLAQKIAATTLLRDGDSLTPVIVERSTGEMVGDALLALTSVVHRQGEIGYALRPGFAGRGYATEASMALLRLGFQTYGLHRICARADGRNIASTAVLERLGMRREAYFVQNEWVKGEWTDEVVYAMLADELIPTA